MEIPQEPSTTGGVEAILVMDFSGIANALYVVAGFFFLVALIFVVQLFLKSRRSK